MGGDAALGNSNMAPFLTKLFQIVSNQQTDQAIIWTPKGDSFVITDPETFARDILPTYFKHNNIRSFIRQLNTYGFRKRTNISSSDEHLEFFHEKFRRDEPALLVQIKRCHQPKPSASAPGGGGGSGGGGGGGGHHMGGGHMGGGHMGGGHMGGGHMGDSMMGEGKTLQDLDTIRGRLGGLRGGAQGQRNGGGDGGVAGLQHLLEAAQRDQQQQQHQQQMEQQHQQQMDPQQQMGQQLEPPSKRMCVDQSSTMQQQA